MKRFGYLNLVLILVLSVSLASLSIFTTVRNNFKDVPSTSRFLAGGNVYNNLAIIAGEQIQAHYPPELLEKPILMAVADRVVDTVVTPELVQSLVEAGLTASTKFAQAPTAIVDDRVVIDTPEYKQQALDFVAQLGLPEFLTNMANNIINAIPGQLVLVDTRTNPNSVLAMIIEARTFLDNAETIRVISWTVFIIALIVLVITNIKKLKTMFLTLTWGFGVGALIILAGSVIISSMLDQGLIGDAVNFFLSQLRRYAALYAGLAVVSFLIWKLVNLEKLQEKISKK